MPNGMAWGTLAFCEEKNKKSETKKIYKPIIFQS